MGYASHTAASVTIRGKQWNKKDKMVHVNVFKNIIGDMMTFSVTTSMEEISSVSAL